MTLGERVPPSLILMAGSTLWGLTWIWLKHAHALGIGPILLTVVAFATQWLVIAPFAWRAWKDPSRRPISRLDGPWLALLAFASGVAGVGFTMAMVYGDVVRSMMLFFLIPAWGVLFGRVFLKEPLTPTRLLAVVSALAGAFLILGPDFGDGLRPADLFALIAGFSLAGANTLFRFLADQPISIKLSLMQGSTVLLGLLAWGLSAEFGTMPTLEAVGSSALYGATMLLAAILATQYAVERLPASRSAILMTLELLVAVASATWLGDRIHGANVWTGGTLILIAALLEATTARHHRPPVAPCKG
ncbi:DMT family transporter [Guyparkeria hydrothermalis]|uniref:DMT family transporter n=1 Tax=Guyparkeria hydrothermalis TaxID=923 RepID=UPI0020224313|nr:DMT family transporter [Guyparkeria hydrothermalis]MCL7743994.1 DMT family transporter [Guyparkeria hydrothermalis]